MKRLFKWVLWLAASIVIAISATAAVLKYRSLSEDYSQFRERLDQLADVKIGETQQELLYAYGNPYMVQNAEYDPNNPSDEKSKIYFPKIDLPKNTKVEDYVIWQWNWKGSRLTAKFDPSTKKVDRLNCLAGIDAEADGLVCLTVGGIGLGSDKSSIGYAFYRRTEDHIISVLGKPDSEEYSKVGDVNRKIISYKELGLTFVMIGKEAINIYKYPTSPSFWWWVQHGPEF